MGIYGALSAAVTGLRAQSHALENISGNIANSQTTGYKRIETDFLDLIPDAPLKRQVPGAVIAQSRGTSDVKGDIKTVSNETFVALNSNGFFVVEPKIGQSDGNSVFAGTNFYTRRGDFEIDKDGRLVNGAGYYLKGLDIDPGTGNISGSVPKVIELSNAFLPAQKTNTINYQANLPQLPKTDAYKPANPNSELMKPWTYANPSPAPLYPSTSGLDFPNPKHQFVPARATGVGPYVGTETASSIVNDEDRLAVTINGQTHNLRLDTDRSPGSAVVLKTASYGAWANNAYTDLSVGEERIGDLYDAGDLVIDGISVPFNSGSLYSRDGNGLQQAVAAAIPGASVSYNELTGQLNVTYTPAKEVPRPTGASGTGVTYQGSATGSDNIAGVTVLTIDSNDIAGLHRTNQFKINGTAVPFTSPLPPTPAGLESAVEKAFPGSKASYSAGELTITYPAGYRPADASAAGFATEVTATGTIDDLLASMQTELRGLTGDSTLWVGLRNGQITVSAGPDDTNPIDFSSLRSGPIDGSILGLDGPHEHVPGPLMAAATTYADLVVNSADTFVVTVGGITRSYSFDVDGKGTPGPGQVRINAGGTVAEMLAAIQNDLRLHGGAGSTGAVVSYGDEGVRLEFPGNYYYDVSVSGSAADKLEISGTYAASPGQVQTIPAAESDRFISESIAGGAVTIYASNGAPANVQLRWAKLDSASADGEDVWNLYYMSNSEAKNSQAMWTRVDEVFRFAANGALASPTNGATKLTGVNVNGVIVGDVELRYDTKGLSQFADVNGTANVSTLNQNGFAAGEFVSVAINDSGRVVATYSNGERIDMAQVVTAQFNAQNSLKRLDGGAFSTTSESGEAILDLSGSGIVGGALEASNTDISDEFTKLIITQQAYSAGTRIVSTADEMLQEALNMIR